MVRTRPAERVCGLQLEAPGFGGIVWDANLNSFHKYHVLLQHVVLELGDKISRNAEIVNGIIDSFILIGGVGIVA